MAIRTMGWRKRLVDLQSDDGSWPYSSTNYWLGEHLRDAWSIIILKGLFKLQPVAVAKATPNPTGLNIQVTLDGSASYHTDADHSIVSYAWDFNADDGIDWTTPDATGVTAITSFDTYGDYTVTLQVTDDTSPTPQTATGTVIVHVEPPPHDPTAVPGGPYTACPDTSITVDGSGSYDIDEPEGDSIVSWGWELDGNAPYDYDDASGETVDWTWTTPGTYNIALKVTDSYGRTNIAWTTVHVDDQYCCTMVTDLTARAKRGKVQLVWTHVGDPRYEIYRSDDGGATFNKIGETTSTYSTYLDGTVVSGSTYQYYVKSGETCSSDPIEITVPITRTR